MYRVALIGELCEDIILHSPKSFMVMGEKIWAKDITITAGGSASYASQALSKMKIKVDLYSVLGDDDSGLRIMKVLSGFDINFDGVKILSKTTTTKSIVLCDGNEKDFQGCSPMLPLYTPSKNDIENIDLLYIAGYALYPELWTDEFVELVKHAKERNIKVLMDCQLLPVEIKDMIEFIRLKEIAPYLDVLLLAKKEVKSLFGDYDFNVAIKQLKELGFVGTAIFKQGAEGAVVASGNNFNFVKRYDVDAYDTVGAGDIFGAGFAYGILNHMSDVDSAKFASCYSALSLGEFIDTKNYPSIDFVKSRYKI